MLYRAESKNLLSKLLIQILGIILNNYLINQLITEELFQKRVEAKR